MTESKRFLLAFALMGAMTAPVVGGNGPSRPAEDGEESTYAIRSRWAECPYQRHATQSAFKMIESEIHSYTRLPVDERGIPCVRTASYPTTISKEAYDRLKGFVGFWEKLYSDPKWYENFSPEDQGQKTLFCQQVRACVDEGLITFEPGYGYAYGDDDGRQSSLSPDDMEPQWGVGSFSESPLP